MSSIHNAALSEYLDEDISDLYAESVKGHSLPGVSELLVAIPPQIAANHVSATCMEPSGMNEGVTLPLCPQSQFSDSLTEFVASSEAYLSLIRITLARAEKLGRVTRVIAQLQSAQAPRACKLACEEAKRVLHSTSNMMHVSNRAARQALLAIGKAVETVTFYSDVVSFTSTHLLSLPDNVLERIFECLEPPFDEDQPEYLSVFNEVGEATSVPRRTFLIKETLCFASTCRRLYHLYRTSYVTGLIVDERLRSIRGQLIYRDTIRGGLARYPKVNLVEVRNTNGIARDLFHMCSCDLDQLVVNDKQTLLAAQASKLISLSATLLLGSFPGREHTVTHLAFTGTNITTCWEPAYFNFAEEFEFQPNSEHWFRTFRNLRCLFTNPTVCAPNINALVLAAMSSQATLRTLYYMEHDPSPTNEFHTEDSSFGTDQAEVSALARLGELRHVRVGFCETLASLPLAFRYLRKLEVLDLRTLCTEPTDVENIFEALCGSVRKISMDSRCFLPEKSRASRELRERWAPEMDKPPVVTFYRRMPCICGP